MQPKVIVNNYTNRIGMSTIEKDFRYYLSHQNELVKQYNGKYIVMVNNKVVGAYDDKADAYYRSLEKYEPGTFLIQLCTPGEEAYTVRYYNNITPVSMAV